MGAASVKSQNSSYESMGFFAIGPRKQGPPYSFSPHFLLSEQPTSLSLETA